MSINLDSGLWQCFKSGNKGNFIQIYSFLEGLTYNQAEADILFKELDVDSTKKIESNISLQQQEEEGELYLVLLPSRIMNQITPSFLRHGLSYTSASFLI